MPQKYLYFDLELYDFKQLDSNNVTFRLRVRQAPGGRSQSKENSDEVKVPGGFNFVLQTITQRHEVTEDKFAKACKDLGDWLLPPDSKARSAYMDCKGVLGLEQSLLLRLRLEDVRLSAIPWEFAMLVDEQNFDNRLHVDRLIVANNKVCFTRFVELTTRVDKTEISKRCHPYILHVSANPEGCDKLDLADEIEQIKNALSNNQIPYQDSLTQEANATFELLRNKLKSGKPNVFQFSGHGGIEGNKGFIRLQDRDFYADQLAMLLEGKGISVAVLAACDTAAFDKGFFWSGVAQKLVEKNIPAVVGMQRAIHDKCCAKFLNAFYSALANHQPIQEAILQGRQALCYSKELKRDFGVAILYLRQDEDWDGVIFPPSDESEKNGNAIGVNGAYATTYKKLHDELQTTKGAFLSIKKYKKDFPPKDQDVREELNIHRNNLKRSVKKFDMIIQAGQYEPASVKSIKDNVHQALSFLDTALDDWNINAFGNSIFWFNQVFTFGLSQLNSLIVSEISELQTHGVLKTLSEQHDCGQKIEDSLDLIEISNGIRETCNNVSKDLEVFKQGLSENNRNELQESYEAMLSSLTGMDDNVVKVKFIAFRSKFSLLFTDVDIELRTILENQ